MYGLKPKPSVRILRCVERSSVLHTAAHCVTRRSNCHKPINRCAGRRQQFERIKAKENECADEKRARAPRTFGYPGAADNVTFTLHGMHEGRSIEDVSAFSSKDLVGCCHMLCPSA